MSLSTALTRCLACGGARLEEYLDLGKQPLANSCHDGQDSLPTFPLGARVCLDCWHSQLTVAVNPELLFKHYLYVSGTTRTLQQYFTRFVERVEAAMRPKAPLRVLDIASNDGSLLAAFKLRGHVVQGIDPAENLRAVSMEKGVPTIVGYWNEAVADALGEQFDVVVAMNVLGHVADPAAFLSLCRRALRPGGRIYIQTSQALMVKNGEFDTIYHEHHSFFNVSSFTRLAARTGLQIQAIDHVPVHGTSYLVELGPGTGAQQQKEDFAIGRLEAEWRYYQWETYAAFAARARTIKARVRDLVAWHRSAGYRLIGYGVAAKGMTFVNFADLDFDYLIDDNPLKVGLLTPGRNNPICGPDRLDREGERALFVILAWNFYDEVVERIRQRKRHPLDGFLSYFPNVAVTSFS